MTRLILGDLRRAVAHLPDETVVTVWDPFNDIETTEVWVSHTDRGRGAIGATGILHIGTMPMGFPLAGPL